MHCPRVYKRLFQTHLSLDLQEISELGRVCGIYRALNVLVCRVRKKPLWTVCHTTTCYGMDSVKFMQLCQELYETSGQTRGLGGRGVVGRRERGKHYTFISFRVSTVQHVIRTSISPGPCLAQLSRFAHLLPLAMFSRRIGNAEFPLPHIR